MKYRLIDTPGFQVKHVSEWEGCGSVVWIHRNGSVQHSRDKEWLIQQDTFNPTGLVARAFEVVQDEWTVDPEPTMLGLWTVRHFDRVWPQALFHTQQAAREYCDWKNGGGV